MVGTETQSPKPPAACVTVARVEGVSQKVQGQGEQARWCSRDVAGHWIQVLKGEEEFSHGGRKGNSYQPEGTVLEI